MKVSIRLKTSSQAITFENVFNTYQKGDLYCIAFMKEDARAVKKFPIADIFDITESY